MEETLKKRKPDEELDEEEGHDRKASKGGGGGGEEGEEGVSNNDSLLSIARYSDDEDEDVRPRAEQNGHSEEEGEEDGDHAPGARAPAQRRQRLVEVRRDCPYLDKVNRQVLDFDFEKFCSISLSNLNVYACLVCGKYYQGIGLKSHAHTHSLEAGHHVYINLQTEKVYCLPDGYEINDP